MSAPASPDSGPGPDEAVAAAEQGDETPLIPRVRAPRGAATPKRRATSLLVTRAAHVRHRSGASTASAQVDHILADEPEDGAPASPLRAYPDVSAAQFALVVDSVREAIDDGVFPTRIHKGSSGSYFARNKAGRIVGVFKPRDEEPYGRMNPKFTKWVHKHLFPFCFGRSCLIPNVGYISEAGASYIDRRLNLGLVPRTEVVTLASPSFHYSKAERWAAKKGWAPLPPKIGSFQIFLEGYEDATLFFSTGYDRLAYLHMGRGHPLGWDEDTQREFRFQFEKLCILDILIRNTDRSLDNLLVRDDTDRNARKQKANAPPAPAGAGSSSAVQRPGQRPASEHSLQDIGASSSEAAALLAPELDIRLGAIDNGLAFPHKHPDNWRSYPPAWSFLPLSHTPFSKETSDLVLPRLTSNEWWSRTFAELEALFRLDPDFDESLFRKQKAVMRGQAFNTVEILRRAALSTDGEAGSPHALVKRPPVMVYEEEVDVEVPMDEAPIGDAEAGETPFKRRIRTIRRRFEAFTRQPCFTNC
ncbi:phosphatidylinositol 3 and 4-kinase-domain-containing protein [Hyaloraphidium curvatum]|nr:phosphatidylinositol 3 and 4-kinase-domain-containing protein [Hyaloraphidium curvatum]